MTTLVARPPTPLAEALPRLDRLVSPFTGLVHGVHEVLASCDDARLVRTFAATPDTRPLIGVEPEPLDNGSGGCADSYARARAAAIGETAERYAAAYVPDGRLVEATAAELGELAVAPSRFALFAPEQYAAPGFPFVPFTSETRIRWTHGFSLPNGGAVLLPAQLVYLRWEGDEGDATLIAHATSNGLACGPTLEEALLAGLLELVERDAFVIAWSNRLSLPLLDWSCDDELLAWEERYLAPAGVRHRVVDLSVFFDVPAALAVLDGDGSREPARAIGGGAGCTAAEAVRKALAEAYCVRTWGRSVIAGRPPRRFAADWSDVRSFADHVELHALAEHAARSAFLTASPERRPLAEVAPVAGIDVLARIEHVCARLAARGCSAYAVDVTTDDVRAAGLAVAKVVAPELCPLDVRHDCRFLGGRRLTHAARELGLVPTPLAPRDLNPDPHPFP